MSQASKLNGSSHVATDKPLLNNSSHCQKHSCQDKSHSSWHGILRKFKLLKPYLWPKDNKLLQFKVVLSFFILAVIRGVSLLTPIYYKKIVDSFSVQADIAKENDSGTTLISISPVAEESQPPGKPEIPFRWDYILVYVLLVSLKGPGGYLTAIRNIVWVRVQQYAARNLQISLFEHLHSLSVGWHISRKTGEVIRVVDRGVHGVTQILNIACSQLLPVIADILIAIVYFFVAFDFWIGLIVMVTMVVYAVVAVVLSEWRTKYRRQANLRDNEKTGNAVDSIMNFETVKVFAAEKWEVNKYAEAVYDHQSAEWLVQATANLYGSARITVMNTGFLAGSLLTAFYVTEGRFTAGDYVMYGTYVMQLYGPLNMLGAYYRLLQQSFIDMEHMFEIFDEQPEITDAKDASHLIVPAGKVEFKNVSFSYMDGYPILKNISFVVPPGKTFALVGESGGGKSTIIKLLFRLYEIQSGKISIDGQDISQVTQNSLRKELGIVPQETALFHADIRYNIRYGSPHAVDAEVGEAARAANIHQMITSLPEGYDSRIGERGLKLSGGERQRVAIARMILKSPKILTLDEATSALDSRTERSIQKELAMLSEGRTCLIIAHRLSTIKHADQILVLKEGHIIERGTHTELLSYNGVYASMWQEQLENSNKPPRIKSWSSFNKASAKTSTPTSLRHAGALSMTESVISEESNGPITAHDAVAPITDLIISDDYDNYHEPCHDGVSLSEKLEAPLLPKNTCVWPRRMSKSLVNLNPKESDSSRLAQLDRCAETGDRVPPRLEHSISLCDAFSLNWDSESDLRKHRRPLPVHKQSPWRLPHQQSLDETRL